MRALFHLLPLSIAAAVSFFSPALQAQQDLDVYADGLVNGFQDWSWDSSRNFNNTSPVHSGSRSISVAISAGGGALRFEHYGSPIDPTAYSHVSFWINGGNNGGNGQLLKVMAVINDDPGPVAIGLPPLPANTWIQYTISLSSLGVTASSVLNGFWIQNSTSNPLFTFYVDDVKFVASVPPDVVNISVDASNILRKAESRWLGLNTAIWDSNFDTASTSNALKDLGCNVLRIPGGSLSDEWHWGTGTSLANTWQWATSFSNFVHVTTNAGVQVYAVANYGTGTAQEAADWVRAANITNHCGYKYWEVGNENYGSWETDSNTFTPYRAHDPWTYAMRFRDYYTKMKAVDPTIKIGAVAAPGEDNYANYRNHVAINLRTGQAHYGWTPVMLATLKELNITPDFLIHHFYPEYQNDSDASLLQAAKNWATDSASLRQQLADYLGSAGTNVEIDCTENNSDSGAQGRQSTSLVNALYLADSLGQLSKTELNSFIWWDLRNGQDSGGDFSISLYGWRTAGDLGIMWGGDVFYPTYYAMKLMQYFVQPADSIIQATSDYTQLSTYAAQRSDGGLTLLVINKLPDTSLNAQIVVTNFIPDSSATVRFYGIPQDDAVQFGEGSPDIDVSTFSGTGTNFMTVFPPYSLTMFTLARALPAAPLLQTMHSASGQFVFNIQGTASSTYVIQSSTDLVNWLPVSTNTISGTALNITNPISSGVTQKFWRAVLKQN